MTIVKLILSIEATDVKRHSLIHCLKEGGMHVWISRWATIFFLKKKDFWNRSYRLQTNKR